MFACFVDFKKAFDSVSYWKLFLKLLNDGVNALIVRLLAAWYCNQICYVRWRSTVSTGLLLATTWLLWAERRTEGGVALLLRRVRRHGRDIACKPKQETDIFQWPAMQPRAPRHSCFHSYIHSFIYLLRITSANKTVCNAMWAGQQGSKTNTNSCPLD